jgi:cytochrome c-type biogenesis protein
VSGLLAATAGVKGALLGPVGFIVAFFVGTVSFFSPCILPLLPGYLSFVSGLSGEEATRLETTRAESPPGRRQPRWTYLLVVPLLWRAGTIIRNQLRAERGLPEEQRVQVKSARRRTLIGILLFVLGFATMFTGLGVAASFIGDFLLRNLRNITRIAGVVVILMGLAFLVPGLLPFLEKERRPFFGRVKPGIAGAYPLGLAFAAGWTPCVGPGLGVMLTLGATQGSAWRAALLLFFFSMGFGIWFLLAGLGIGFAVNTSHWLRARLRIVQAVGGVFMIAIGLLLVTDQWNNVIAPIERLVNRFAPPI